MNRRQRYNQLDQSRRRKVLKRSPQIHPEAQFPVFVADSPTGLERPTT